MNQVEQLKTEIEGLRDRLARLSEACSRVNETLEVKTVLDEVVEHVRVLTGARHALLTIDDGTEREPDCVMSGFTPEEHQRVLDLPGARDLYEHLRRLPGPLNVPKLGDHLASLGIPPELSGEYGEWAGFLAVPMRHGGVQVGNLFVAPKEGGGEFTKEDQEVLVLFASQAARAITNARRYRDEQRAKADLEALIDTAPVGVAVFDARTGQVLSLNREAERIVGVLCAPGGSVLELLEVLTVRWSDGREVCLRDSPLQGLLHDATAVRAEEVVIEVPDGRRLSLLVNATPIRTESGEAESVVVTLQDMTPVEDVVRMRAEFVGMVSDELRAPLLAIKGCTATVLGTAEDLDSAETRQFFRVIDEQVNQMREIIGDLLDAGRIEAGTLSVDPESSAVADLVEQARNNFLSAGGRNPLQLELPPDLPRVRADRRRIVQVLGNLLSNASRHSAERAPIGISASRDDVYVSISISDEGMGVSAQMLPHLFQKFFRTEGKESGQRTLGSGLDLAVCKGLVEAHGGRIRAESDGPGHGTRFTFTLPAVAESADQARPGAAAGGARPGAQVLVVDDDPQTLRYVRQILEEAGYSVVVTGDPQAVPRLLEARMPALVLLDLVMPGWDGIELLEETPALQEVPVIFLSAYGREETVARALDRGAVDYVVKPFSPTELLARINAALRGRAGAHKAFALGDVEIDYDARRVTLAGRPLELTATEYGLLRELAVNAGRVLAYEVLLRRVWGLSDSTDARRVRAYIKRLRAKLGDDATDPRYILTVHRVGYRMPKPGEEQESLPPQ